MCVRERLSEREIFSLSFWAISQDFEGKILTLREVIERESEREREKKGIERLRERNRDCREKQRQQERMTL